MPQEAETRVLLVDDSVAVASALARHLSRAGFVAEPFSDARSALERLAKGDVRVVVSDISMPDMNGIQLLQTIRERDQDLPVVLMTATPNVSSATDAVDYGAFRYLTKPIETAELVATVRRAAKLHELNVAKREALATLEAKTDALSANESLEACLDRAVSALWMAYQPIVDAKTGSLYGYEALLRSEEPSLPHPGAIIDAAQRLGALSRLGRAVRTRVASDIAGANPDWHIFVNLHPSDLTDLEALEAHAGLELHASRVVLEITERAALETVRDLGAKIADLRGRGYSLAVDDLGAGYSGLSSFVRLEPEFVKLDMSLVRDAHKSPVKAKLVRSITGMCRDMGTIVVAEGIETIEERDALTDLGCDLLQGFYFGRPSRPFVAARW